MYKDIFESIRNEADKRPEAGSQNQCFRIVLLTNTGDLDTGNFVCFRARIINIRLR